MEVQPQHLDDTGGQIFTTKQCSGQANLAFSSAFILLFKSKAAARDHLLKVEWTTTARLGGKGNISS